MIAVRARLRKVVAVLAVALVVPACGGDGEPTGSSDAAKPAGAQKLQAQVASYDLAAGEETRFIVGLLTPDQLLISYGTVDMEFFFLGANREETSEGRAQPGPRAAGRFLPIPVEGPPRPRPGPVALPASKGRGVYAAHVRFDKAGIWGVRVTADLRDGDTVSADATFVVSQEHRVPAPGDEALRTQNLTLDSDAPDAAIDSRAAGSAKVPDPGLHRDTIASSIEEGKPAVVTFSTPVYCVSRFCGPITDMIEKLSRRFSHKADFIHVEIWRDYQKQELNAAAAEWLLRDQNLQEPWVFLIDGNGRIIERWDNVATEAEVTSALRRL